MFDIDMQSYAGANDSAAVNQPNDTNFYSNEVQDAPVFDETLIDAPKTASVEVTPEIEVNPQSENFRALREEVDRIKSERETERQEHQLQVEMLRANLDRANASREQKPERQMFEGMKDDDIPNVAEIKREWSQREAGYQARIEELQVQQMHPDYQEVIEKYVVPLVKSKPHLAEGIHGAQNKALFAYELGKMYQMSQQQPAPAPVQQPQVSQNAQRIVENSKKPGTLSQAGGQGTLSKADYFATMSDAEFMRMAQKNLDSI